MSGFTPGSTPRAAVTGRARHVEAQPCPDRDGPHWLINERGETVCRGCGETWAALDSALNAGLATRRGAA